MLSKNQRNQILQLKKKKYRQDSGLFVAEGEKVVEELLAASWNCTDLYVTTPHFHPQAIEIDIKTMKQITHFKSPSPVLAVFEIPNRASSKAQNISIAVDGVSDPGNLGTLIRLCDWFGLDELICSKTTVDCFNSKVVQASMGSLVRVHCQYKEDLGLYLERLQKPIYGADLNGTSLYKTIFSESATLVFGSESHGLSKTLRDKVDHFVSIPNFRSGRGAESLNVALSSAIFLNEIFRTK
jgi:TrmH family RNA methyltransferase